MTRVRTALASIGMLVSLLIALTVSVPTVAIAQDSQAGADAYDRGDYAEAMRLLRPLAEQGDVQAQFTVGWMYAYGEGVPQDHVQARRWYRMAADQNHAGAQTNLGVLYMQGEGGPQDYDEARRLFLRSAAQGNGWAQHNLGYIYFSGLGVPKDYAEARRWLEQAVESGYEASADALRMMDERGL